MKWIFLTFTVCFGVTVAAETRPASEAELRAIRTAFSLDAIPEWKHYEVMNVEGSYIAGDDKSPGKLRGVVWFRPYLIQDSLCLVETFYKHAVESDEGFDWEQSMPVYRYWEAQAQDNCEIDDRSQIPSDMVTAYDALPSADLVQIIRNSDELLAIAMRLAIEEVDFESQWEKGSKRPAQERARYRRFQADKSLNLVVINLLTYPIPGQGFAYVAKFAGDEGTYGPTVTFSVMPSAFAVHSVGWWVE